MWQCALALQTPTRSSPASSSRRALLTCASPAYLERRGVPRTPHDLAHHECLLFRDPRTGRPFPWEFHRGKQIIEIAVTGRVMMDDPSAAVAACIAGQGVFQSLEIGLTVGSRAASSSTFCPTGRMSSGRSTPTIPSRHLPPAKVRAFLDFVQEIAGEATTAGNRRTRYAHVE